MTLIHNRAVRARRHIPTGGPVSDRESHDYHIKIVGASSRMRTSGQQRINIFLEDLFEPDDSPLEFSNSDFNGNTSDASANVLLVRLKLTNTASMTLNGAAEKFCKLMFSSQADEILRALTPNGLFGVSALPGPFKQHWIQAFFRDPRLPGRIDPVLHIPDWVVVRSFAAMVGLDIAPVGAAPGPLNAGKPSAAIIVLRRFMISRISSEPEIEKKKTWKQQRIEFASSIDTLSAKLGEVINSTAIGTNTSQHYALYNTLYDATLAAAKALTSNKDIFNESVKLRNDAVLGTTVAALTCFRTAFTTATLPFVPLPIKIAAAGISALYSAKGYLNVRKFNKQIDYHRNMNTYIVRAWKLAHDSQTLLQWVHITDASRPSLVDFVDDAARSQWEEFIQSVRNATGGNATNADLGPQMVLAYLSEQYMSLNGLRMSLSRPDEELDEED